MRRRTPKEGKAEECWVREGEEKKERAQEERTREMDGGQGRLEVEGP